MNLIINDLAKIDANPEFDAANEGICRDVSNNTCGEAAKDSEIS